MTSLEDIYNRLAFGLSNERQAADPLANLAELKFQFRESSSKIEMIGERDSRVAEVAKVNS